MPMFSFNDPSKLDIGLSFDLSQVDIDPRLKAIRKTLDDATTQFSNANAALQEDAIITALSTQITAGEPIEHSFTVSAACDKPAPQVTMAQLLDAAKQLQGGTAASISIDCTFPREQILNVGSHQRMFRDYGTSIVRPQVSVRITGDTNPPPQLNVPTGTGLASNFSGPLQVGVTGNGNTFWSNSSGPAIGTSHTHTPPAPPAEQPPAPHEAKVEPLVEGHGRGERAVEF